MVCRHERGDPNCSSNRSSYSSYESSSGTTPDASRFSIEEAERIGAHLVLKVKYPNCALCAYEGMKVMVFLNVTELQVLKWKTIDPHFRAPNRTSLSNAAPSPAARFPASPEGWSDALAYARGKVGHGTR